MPESFLSYRQDNVKEARDLLCGYILRRHSINKGA